MTTGDDDPRPHALRAASDQYVAAAGAAVAAGVAGIMPHAILTEHRYDALLWAVASLTDDPVGFVTSVELAAQSAATDTLTDHVRDTLTERNRDHGGAS